MTDCVFCEIVAGRAPATIIREWPNVTAFLPLNPVVLGHLLVIPNQHVTDAAASPGHAAMTMRRAAELCKDLPSSNIITSIGAPATQSIFHLHIHVVPREPGDQLMLPWGTTGDPHLPHRCKGMDERDEALARVNKARN